jgi:hypothetical protein
MVLTKSELIESLNKEVRILVHLTDKIDRTMVDYRPTPKQRGTLDLLRYLTYMGPLCIQAAKAGVFDLGPWKAAQEAASGRDFDQTVAALRALGDEYATLLAEMSDADLRGEMDMFGNKSSKGAFLVNLLICGHAAYRTQLFLYLKACGREELNTMNLWAGVDAPMAAAV